MTVALKKQLDESLRDALLALYLNTVAPHDETTKELGLKTAEQLYEYWLLDVLVSQDVPTTPVACAVASLQQYINRILMNMEPGYDSTSITPGQVQTWRDEMHQYSTWAAHQKLLYFPSTYLDPTLRTNKSENFRQLENDLNQNRVQPDAVQSAVMAYLTRFEEVANLNILNGYIDGEDFANSHYYFIAKSRSENTYFWRSLNMAQRPLDGTPTTNSSTVRKLDQPDPYAWSDWEKADVPISDNAIEHTIRPVWFNNRLFVVWAECTHQDSDAATHTGTASQTFKSHPELTLNLCYRKPDKNWSAPRTVLKTLIKDEIVTEKDTDAIKQLVSTIAIHRNDASQNSLLMALALNKKHEQLEYTILKEATLDNNLTPTTSTTQKAGIYESYSLFKSSDETPLQFKFTRLAARSQTTYLEESTTYTSTPIGFAPLVVMPLSQNGRLTKLHLKSRSDNPLPNNYNAVKWTIEYYFLKRTTEYTIKDLRNPLPSGHPVYPTSCWFGDLKIMTNVQHHPILKHEKFFTIDYNTLKNGPQTLYLGIILSPNNRSYGKTNEDNISPYEHTAYVDFALTLSINPFTSPKIIRRNSTQYIDFTGSLISKNDKNNQPRAPIRLNTTFTAEMIRRLENSLDELFSWETQHLPEPKISEGAPQPMDFHGPYGRYFTELFLYLPWLVAQRLNTEHRYEEAERWLRYAFDPARKPADCWRVVPLSDSGMAAYSDQAPHDPHQIALSYPVHFRKALYFIYLDILINRGDAAYRALTPDSLSEAKLFYVRTLDLLGPRPAVEKTYQWPNISLQTLSKTTNPDLRAVENLPASRALLIRAGNSQTSSPTIDSPHLRLPFSPELVKRWDIAESRLYNLRHNLDMAGKPLSLPLFAAPLDPRVLNSSKVLNTSGGTASDLSDAQIPHHRFTAMHSQALSAVESLSQFGATLLSLIERKEQSQLQELQQQQAWDLAKMSVDLQAQALRIDRQNRQTLLASKAIVQGRANHYQHLLEVDVSEAETEAGQLYLDSGAAELVASASQVIAGGLMMAPNIFGLSNGGIRWEGAAHAASALAQYNAISDRTTAASLDRTAQFERRRQEWTLTRDQAQLELAQIDAQLAHFAEQETATRLQLRLAESTLSHAKANYEFLTKRFTKTQLYQWLNSQFATFYRQAYDTTLALCLAAEACWQYEIAAFSTRFIQPGAWSTTYRGLGAGEQLKLSLMKMQAEYLQRHERELEIRKTVSLRQLNGKTTTATLDTPPAPPITINKDWSDIHTDLKKGECEFELTQEMFEDDYKGQNHYLRRIKTISVSLPAVVGPYENIRATLMQTSSKVFLSADATSTFKENLRASQQIALSTGVDDNGLFTLNFNDERYLPFEYTGAISKWVLTFPNPDAQKAMLESLTDVIVHVCYTARVGGA